MVQVALRAGCGKNKEEPLCLLPDPAVEEFQSGADAPVPTAAASDGITLVFFLRGVTSIEIAALKHVAAHDTAGGAIVVSASMIVNAISLIGCLTKSLKACS